MAEQARVVPTISSTARFESSQNCVVKVEAPIHLPILASNVVDGSGGAIWIDIRVRPATVALLVGFLLEVGAVFLLVSGAELSVTAQVALFADDGSVFWVAVVALGGCECHEG